MNEFFTAATTRYLTLGSANLSSGWLYESRSCKRTEHIRVHYQSCACSMKLSRKRSFYLTDQQLGKSPDAAPSCFKMIFWKHAGLSGTVCLRPLVFSPMAWRVRRSFIERKLPYLVQPNFSYAKVRRTLASSTEYSRVEVDTSVS